MTDLWYKGCVTKAEEIVEFLQARGYCNLKVIQWDSDAWVLEVESKETYKQLLKEDQEWVQVCFTFIRPWKEDDVIGRRRVWISVYGVPLHAWGRQLFRKIGNQFGKVVEIDEATLAKKDLRRGRILIDTPLLSTICRSVQFQVWNKSFDIKVLEDWGVRELEEGYSSAEVGRSPDSEQSEAESFESSEEDDEIGIGNLFINEDRQEDNEAIDGMAREGEFSMGLAGV